MNSFAKLKGVDPAIANRRVKPNPAAKDAIADIAGEVGARPDASLSPRQTAGEGGVRNQWSQYRLLKSLTASGGEDCSCEGSCASGWVEDGSGNCTLSIVGEKK